MTNEAAAADESLLSAIRWNDQGLVAVIAQEQRSQRVLMMAWMNEQALQQTLSLGKLVYWSRSRQQLWRKGETSGHTQLLKSLRIDCDGDVLLAEVEQIGGMACHTGRTSCFYRELSEDHERWQTTDPVLRDPSDIYSGSA